MHFNEPFRENIKNILIAVKRELIPTCDPEEWTLHVKDLRSPQWRAKNDVKHDTASVNKLIRRVACSLGENQTDRFLAATIMQANGLKSFPSKGEIVSYARDNTLTAALFGVTEFLTRNGFSLDFVLESQGTDFKSNQIDWYVERIGRAFRFYIGYHWISRCKYVGLPTTAPKGKHFELELADILAFSVNRYFHTKRINRNTEFPLTDFGNIFWGYFVENRFGTHLSIDFPWEHFHPNTRVA
jgi:hypothetical protein